MLKTKELLYKDQETTCHGYLAYDDAKTHKKPLVLICHDWSGLNEFAKKKADLLAELGFIGFAVDMYGEGRIGASNDEKLALMMPLVTHRDQLKQRILAAFDAGSQLEQVDKTRIAVIGFCFGGLCALDLARSGADLKGAVSFHGLLNAPNPAFDAVFQAKVLVLHGHEDPSMPAQDVADFQAEMTALNVDWQFHTFSHTMHAFMNPLANDPEGGKLYSPLAEKRSMQALQDFLAEIFH